MNKTVVTTLVTLAVGVGLGVVLYRSGAIKF